VKILINDMIDSAADETFRQIRPFDAPVRLLYLLSLTLTLTLTLARTLTRTLTLARARSLSR